MIRSEQEYQRTLEQLQEQRALLAAQERELEALGLAPDEVERAMHPVQSFHAQLTEEVELYERMRRGDLGPLRDLGGIGQWLIGMRIARGMTQSELADLLEVAPSQVSRDEVNEYHGISVERAQRILEALGVRFEATVDSLDLSADWRRPATA